MPLRYRDHTKFAISVIPDLLLNSTFSHYLTPYLSHTHPLTVSAFYGASASPISSVPRNKLDPGADILPLSPLLLLGKLVWGR